jgi:hypothetical protein
MLSDGNFAQLIIGRLKNVLDSKVMQVAFD